MKNVWWKKTGPPVSIRYILTLNDYFIFGGGGEVTVSFSRVSNDFILCPWSQSGVYCTLKIK